MLYTLDAESNVKVIINFYQKHSGAMLLCALLRLFTLRVALYSIGATPNEGRPTCLPLQDALLPYRYYGRK